MAKKNTKKKREIQTFKAETLWRLVDAKCAEIKDAISGTRMPLFLVLLFLSRVLVFGLDISDIILFVQING